MVVVAHTDNHQASVRRMKFIHTHIGFLRLYEFYFKPLKLEDAWEDPLSACVDNT